MKYSRNQLNNTGQVLISATDDLLRLSAAVTLVEDWRKNHQVPMLHLFQGVSAILSGAGLQAAFSSQRLKRMTSITDKLRRNTEMRLGGVQDIGGVRFVFDDVDTLEKAKAVLEKTVPDGFETERTYNYVANPKESGYRSIHFVYKFHSDDEETDGLRIELQIRTRLQHDWATAVETAELISRSPLKSGTGDKEWLDFFKLVSAIFARKEKSPVHTYFTDFTEQQFCRTYSGLDNSHHFLELLNSLAIAVKHAGDIEAANGYALLYTDFENHSVSFRHYTEEKFPAANAMYAQMESRLDNTKGAVVLVSVHDMDELREAYPSYFLNASEFVAALKNFTNDCKLKGYL